MLRFLILSSALILGLANGFDIEASIQGDGADEDNPVEEGRSLTMSGRMSLNNGEVWSSCTWSKKIEKDQSEDETEGSVGCSIVRGSRDGSCNSSPGFEYLIQNIDLTESSSECKINLGNAKPGHSGEWKVHVNTIEDDSKVDQIEAYVSKQAELHISEPDVEKDHDPIKYDLSSSRPRIEATCKSIGGSPPPKFIWFIDDNKNEIREGDANAKMDERDLGHNEMEGRITFSPNKDDLCNKFRLDQACSDFTTLTFSLNCMADQGNYYRDENNRQPASVLVEVSGTTKPSLSLGIVLTAIVSYLSLRK